MITVDLYQIIGFGAGGASALIGVIWAVLKTLFLQMEKRLDERFAHLEGARHAEQAAWLQRHDTMQANLRQLEQDVAAFKLEVSTAYSRREDAIRDTMALQSKIENMSQRLSDRIDNLASSLRAAHP